MMSMKSEVKAATNGQVSLDLIKPLRYKTQVVAGTKWTIVYSIGGGNVLELGVV